MANKIFECLNLTAVGCVSDITLPSLKFVSQVLEEQLSDIGMSSPHSRGELTKNFDRRERNKSDPRYSFDFLKESQTDVLGLYSTDLSGKAEITLYVDSCASASTDLSLSLIDLLQIVLAHEIAHHTTAWAEIHLNIQVEDFEETYRYCWMDYNKCVGGTWSSVHEYFAQALAFVCLAAHHKGLLDSFRTLSRYQPSVYRTWEVLDAFTLKGIGLQPIRASIQNQFLALLQAGKRFFPEIETMHRIFGYDS
jgi:hypothetical protein